jgi:alkylation response protein AidB-like acyl-CoA dehydrogenase
MSGAVLDTARLIAHSAASFAAAHGGCARARQRLDGAAGGLDRDVWRAMAALGWFGIDVPEASGGLALGAPAACLVAEEAGRALLMPPLTMSMAAASLLAHAASPLAEKVLSSLLDGRRVVALAPAHHPPGTTERVDVTTLADADVADALVVGLGGSDDFEARLVERPAGGVSFSDQRCVDGSWLGCAAIPLQAWSVAACVTRGPEGWAAWRRANNLLRLGDAAYLCGVASSALAMGLEYLRLRRQFGVPIGSFQALQHRAADCHILSAGARALVHEAARAFATRRQTWACAAAVRRAADAALHVATENVQFHGAIGFSDEHHAGLILRRTMVVASRHGTQAWRALREGLPRD